MNGRLGYFLKVFSLVFTLVVVLLMINGITPRHIQRFFGAIDGTTSGVSSDGADSINLCQTRIASFEFGDGKKIEENQSGLKVKWMAENGGSTEMNFLEVEKWLGRHCRVSGTAPTGARLESPAGRLAVKIGFVKGSSLDVESLPAADLYRIGERIFHSPELTQALKELRKLAQFD